MLELTSLPAREGDALWVRWGDDDSLHQMFIDMGTEGTGRDIQRRLEALPVDQRKIDLLVVTHVDRDHIGGVLTCLAESVPLPGLTVDDVWFNGFEHLSGGQVGPSPALRPLGAVQGERLSVWLGQQPWNRAFNGGPIQRDPATNPPTVTLHDGLRITVLAPTPARLTGFIDTWEDEVAEALREGTLDEVQVSPGLRPMGSDEPPVLEGPHDLRVLAETTNDSDRSEANGSSIVLLLEYKGRRLLLAGDARNDDLVDGVVAVSEDGAPLVVDVVKLPHHGSKKNVMRELIEAVECRDWLISTDGTRFRHPDAAAVARALHFSRVKPPRVCFNVPSAYNEWWDNASWKSLYDYTAHYGTEEDGLTFRFDDNE